ncbi:MAG: 5-formyltetrahydrofolate cyclo-ligase [Clostridia bacterium]|nr:5-formyltetrahydrofolate cyclo-ligase [Clostridia bacterium]
MSLQSKQELRKALRSAFPGVAQRNAESQSICRHLCQWPVLQHASVVAAYIPLPREADITPVLAQVLEAGHTLALPRCGKAPNMIFHAVSSLAELVPGAYGIPEPKADAPAVAPEEFSLVLVPLEGVDGAGHRLGKGCGYYDNLLTKTNCLSVGIALSWQECDSVPVEEQDRPLDAVADAEGIRIFRDIL